MKKILNILNSLLLFMGFLFLLNGCKESDDEKPSILADIATVNVTSISIFTAVSGGNITNDNGFTIIQRGVCWSINVDPTINDSITLDGTGTGNYVSNLKNLLPATQYYLRAYAKSDKGISYGSTLMFTTLAAKVYTSDSYSALLNTAICNGSISDSGGYAIIRRGVCWSKTNTEPDINDSFINALKNTTTFTCKLSGLTANTTYYVRAFAETSRGIGYGEKRTITTADSILTDTDNNEYKVIQIGNQIWMAENLEVVKYGSMIIIPLVHSQAQWDALTITNKAYCFYGDNSSYRDSYGALYTWAAAMNGSASSSYYPSGIQGVCPTGWHLPSNAEWDTLIRNAGGPSVAGGKLKQKGTTFWETTNTNVTDELGFSARACGRRDNTGVFSDKLIYSIWWSSTEYNAINALNRQIDCNNNIYTYSPGKEFGLSVRCVKN